MLLIVQVIFWISLLIVFYSYVGYGFLLYIWLKIRGKKKAGALNESELPPLALIIAAYNEEDYILEKIKNTRELQYPKGKLRVIFVTDGSTDQTTALVRQFTDLECWFEPERKGKAHALNRVVAGISEPIIVSCDANTYLNPNCLINLVQHYVDPQVGGVAGEKRILKVEDGKAVVAGEGLYWRYEGFLKQMDSDLHTVVGAAGELFSVRRSLYQPIEPGTIIEDFVLTMRICEQGYTVKYEPNAWAAETASASMVEERKRKVRISAGGFQAMAMLKNLLNWKKYGLTTFQYVSHRVLRWAVCPPCLLLILLSNLALIWMSEHWIYAFSLIAQIFFYMAAWGGYWLSNREIKIGLLYVPYYFVFMNLSVFAGYRRYQAGQQSVLWEKAKRQAISS